MRSKINRPDTPRAADPIGKPGLFCRVNRHLADHGITTGATIHHLSLMPFSGMLSLSNSYVQVTVTFFDSHGDMHYLTCLRQPGVEVGDVIIIRFCSYYPEQIFQLARNSPKTRWPTNI